MKRYRLYILDLDGTLFRGDEPIEGAADTVRQLQDDGAAVRYLTNNSGRTRGFYEEKLARMGFPVRLEEIYSSAIGTAKHCQSEGIRSAYVVGEPGLVETLREGGVECVNSSQDGRLSEEERPAEAVIAGICRSFTYGLMNGAMQSILRGARFIATNADATYPLEGGRLIPGAGSIVRSIATCSGKEPFVVGKPNPFLVELILSEAGVLPKEALVVGDRLDTDIESGRRAGCDTFLVLTGVEKEAPSGQAYSQDLRGLL